MSNENTIPSVSMAEKFMVVDESGNKRAVLGFKQGVLSLTLFASDGRERAVLKLDPKGTPSLEMFDQDGRARAVLGLKEDGAPFLKAKK